MTRVKSEFVNSGSVELHPDIASGGLELYFASHRRGGRDLYVAWREDQRSPFTEGRALDEVNTENWEGNPKLSADGNVLYFSANEQSDGEGDYDLYVARRDATTGRFGPREVLGPSVNTTAREGNPELSVDGLELYFTRGSGFGGDLYVARRANPIEPFGEATPLDALNSDTIDAGPSLSADGLTLFFWRNPQGSAPAALWMATRTSTEENFSTPPVLLEWPLNGGFDWSPSISHDWPASGATLYFTRCTSGSECSIYQATWSAVSFRRGDCNDDGTVDISDAVFSLGSLFLGDGDPGCDDACDSNDDGRADVSDAINTLGVIFLGQGTIPLPGMTECGVDPTEDEVGCDTFERCP